MLLVAVVVGSASSATAVARRRRAAASRTAATAAGLARYPREGRYRAHLNPVVSLDRVFGGLSTRPRCVHAAGRGRAAGCMLNLMYELPVDWSTKTFEWGPGWQMSHRGLPRPRSGRCAPDGLGNVRRRLHRAAGFFTFDELATRPSPSAGFQHVRRHRPADVPVHVPAVGAAIAVGLV
jgi:hypothetical protein